MRSSQSACPVTTAAFGRGRDQAGSGHPSRACPACGRRVRARPIHCPRQFTLFADQNSIKGAAGSAAPNRMKLLLCWLQGTSFSPLSWPTMQSFPHGLPPSGGKTTSDQGRFRPPPHQARRSGQAEGGGEEAPPFGADKRGNGNHPLDREVLHDEPIRSSAPGDPAWRAPSHWGASSVHLGRRSQHAQRKRLSQHRAQSWPRPCASLRSSRGPVRGSQEPRSRQPKRANAVLPRRVRVGLSGAIVSGSDRRCCIQSGE